jgi:DNA-binding MarR family transcriptional regulator
MDDIPSTLPSNTLYNLMQQLSAMLDKRAVGLRRGSRYQDVRPSDVRTFVQVARKARGESEIAQIMNISRQAVQSSVKRLAAMQLVEVVPMPGNGRNKIVQVTEKGAHARDTAADHIRIVEAEFAAIIGVEELERLRGLLLHLTTGYRDKLSKTDAHATGV